MPTQTVQISANFGASYASVDASEIFYRVVELGGTERIARTNATVEAAGDGSFYASVDIDPAWTLTKLRVEWDDGGEDEEVARRASAAIDVQVTSGSGSAGTGDIIVNHDTGGTDNLRFTDAEGNGIDDATVTAYLKAEYDVGGRVGRGETFTGTDGRWVEDMKLNAGVYRFVFTKAGYDTASLEETVS